MLVPVIAEKYGVGKVTGGDWRGNQVKNIIFIIFEGIWILRVFEQKALFLFRFG